MKFRSGQDNCGKKVVSFIVKGRAVCLTGSVETNLDPAPPPEISPLISSSKHNLGHKVSHLRLDKLSFDKWENWYKSTFERD